LPERTIRADVVASDDPNVLGSQDAVIVMVKASARPEVAADRALAAAGHSRRVRHERHPQA